MQVIRAQGGVYLSNQSISATPSPLQAPWAGFLPKAGDCRGGEEPDHILLYASTLNDANFGIPLDVPPEYQALLGKPPGPILRSRSTAAPLLLGAIAGTTNSMACFVQRLVPYNEAIRAAVQATGCHLVDPGRHRVPLHSLGRLPPPTLEG